MKREGECTSGAKTVEEFPSICFLFWGYKKASQKPVSRFHSSSKVNFGEALLLVDSACAVGSRRNEIPIKKISGIEVVCMLCEQLCLWLTTRIVSSRGKGRQREMRRQRPLIRGKL